jgi:hypothetical protein
MLLLLFSFLVFSCSREPGEPPPTPVDRTPAPPADTVSFVQRLEEFFVQGNPYSMQLNRVYTFTYDQLNRVASVGITNHNHIQFDTATTRLFYTGSNMRPSMIITPNVYTGNASTPPLYDTTYFSYDARNRPVKDSCLLWGYYNTSAMQRRLTWRSYFYPDSSTIIVHWYAPVFANRPPSLARQDTIELTATKSLEKSKTQYFGLDNNRSNYLMAEGFTADTIINPLAKLNIGGMIFSYLYTPAHAEVLGNSFHKAVYNSNILPAYVDFFSPLLPKSFYLGGFTENHFLIGAQYDGMSVAVSPWQKRSRYPAEISVRGSTSLPDDRFVYRYHYR